MKLNVLAVAIFSMSLSLAGVCADKPYVITRALTMDMANKVAVTAAVTCNKQGYQVAVAVVDRTGNLLAFLRDPLSGPHTIAVSQRKAYTAATYQTASGSVPESQSMRFTPGVILLRGGLPIRAGGRFYGAVGVSGAPAKKTQGDIDESCAQAGIDAIKDALEFSD